MRWFDVPDFVTECQNLGYRAVRSHERLMGLSAMLSTGEAPEEVRYQLQQEFHRRHELATLCTKSVQDSLRN